MTVAATEEGSSMSEDSFAVHGGRARNARPSFLLSQTQWQEIPVSVGSSGSGSSESAERSGVREKGGVRERTTRRRRWRRKRRDGKRGRRKEKEEEGSGECD